MKLLVPKYSNGYIQFSIRIKPPSIDTSSYIIQQEHRTTQTKEASKTTINDDIKLQSKL